MIDDNQTEENKTENQDEHIHHSEEAESESGSRFQEFFSEEVETRGPKITDTLAAFLEMKEIDEELYDIEQEKGDLPENIVTLKGRLGVFESELAEKRESLAKLNEEMSRLKHDNSSIEEKISRYDEQKFSVRNNKEYDEIVKAIDSLFDEVKKNEERNKELQDISRLLDEDVRKLDEKSSEFRLDLEEKQKQLDELNEQYKQDEIALREKRQTIVAKLDDQSASLYERINSSFKGEATAIVRKGNCSGCYNSIPPQRVIEINAAEKIFTCQSCGRILIPESISAHE